MVVDGDCVWDALLLLGKERTSKSRKCTIASRKHLLAADTLGILDAQCAFARRRGTVSSTCCSALTSADGIGRVKIVQAFGRIVEVSMDSPLAPSHF